MMIRYIKICQLAGLLILLTYTVACGNGTHSESEGTAAKATEVAATTDTVPEAFETGKLIPHIVCKSDPSQSYALYIPAKGGHDSLPVIYFFDPHGDGTLPVAKYRTLADHYNFILIGSNNSKNGNDWTTTENSWNILSFDTKKRLRINVSRIYTCGFSGGAKVAGYVALNHTGIKGVIAGGAALPDATAPGDFRFSFTAIAGEGDMNMTDLVAFNAALDKTQTTHRIIFFDGKHEWCPESTMNVAVTALQFDAMREKLIPKDDAFITKYSVVCKKRINDYLQANNYIKAEAECRLSVAMLNGLSNTVNEFIQKDASLKNNAVFQKQWQARQELLTAEQKMKALYSQQFQQADVNYWVNAIHDLQTKANATTAEGAMNQRLLAYLSLAFYSISNQLINSHRDEEARHFVELYKLDDAANPEAWYFSAILNARNGNAKAVKDDLQMAVQNGFSDKDRLEHQPEFQNTQIDLSEIERKMK